MVDLDDLQDTGPVWLPSRERIIASSEAQELGDPRFDCLMQRVFRIPASQNHMRAKTPRLRRPVFLGVILDLADGIPTQEKHGDGVLQDVGNLIDQLVDGADRGCAKRCRAGLVVFHADTLTDGPCPVCVRRPDATTRLTVAFIGAVFRSMVVDAIKYTRGLIQSLEDKSKCKTLLLPADTFPRKIHDLIRENRIQDLDGTWGDPDCGSPIEYEELELIGKPKNVRVEVINRGIMVLSSDGEAIKRIHRVLTAFMMFQETFGT